MRGSCSEAAAEGETPPYTQPEKASHGPVMSASMQIDRAQSIMLLRTTLPLTFAPPFRHLQLVCFVPYVGATLPLACISFAQTFAPSHRAQVLI